MPGHVSAHQTSAVIKLVARTSTPCVLRKDTKNGEAILHRTIQRHDLIVRAVETNYRQTIQRAGCISRTLAKRSLDRGKAVPAGIVPNRHASTVG